MNIGFNFSKRMPGKKVLRPYDFYDVKEGKHFSTANYKAKCKKNPKTHQMVYYLSAKSPDGNKAARFISKEDYDKLPNMENSKKSKKDKY